MSRLGLFGRLGLVGLAGLAVLATGNASAQDAYPYAGLSVGASRARIDDERISASLLAAGLATTSMSRDESALAYKLFGGYQLNRHVAIEGGYFDLGRFGFESITEPPGSLSGRIRLRGVNLDLVGTLPLSERFSLLGRVGAQYASARDKFEGTGAVSVQDPSPSRRELNYKFGAGLQYEVGRSFLIRGEAERYRVNDAVGNHGGVNVFSVSLVFPFGRAPAASRPAMAAPPPPPPPIVAAAPPVAPRPPPPPPMVVSPERRRVSFSADSLFAFDRSDIRPEGRVALDSFARELQGTRYDVVRVEGHTDRLGTTAYNQRLSGQRAESVKAYLVGQGLDNAKIVASGHGESTPVTSAADCAGEKANPRLIACLQPDRRVVVEVTGTR